MEGTSKRTAPIDISPAEFRTIGHHLVDRIARYMEDLPAGRVTPGETLDVVRSALGQGSMPQSGSDPGDLLATTADLLYQHSLFIGHPRFWGYITSAAAPIGMLGDMLAASVNPNVASWILSPIATEIEAQSIRWMAEMIGYSPECGGLLVSGGNVANYVGFLSARAAQANWDIRSSGLRNGPGELRVYVSAKTHTWIQNATDLFGLGTNSIRWVPVDEKERLRPEVLEQWIEEDSAAGHLPFLVVGTAGTVGSGAIDPLPVLAEICERHDLWFHVDGAYGAFAAILPDAPNELEALARADSIALDPHKWLYSPLEAGCALVRDIAHLRRAFSFKPEYYTFADRDDGPLNYFELGLQNSRGFRALKVWLGLNHVGLDGYRKMIADDIALSRALFALVEEVDELEAISNSLSVTTFRFRPIGVEQDTEEGREFLNELNRRLLDEIQAGGEAFLSNAIINGVFALRACIVNFRTSSKDIAALPEIVLRAGRKVYSEMSQP